MFKFVSKNKALKEKLRVVEKRTYDYLLTTDSKYCEAGKINIVFDEEMIDTVNKMLDLIVAGEDFYLHGYNQNGQRRVMAKNVFYIESISEEVYFVIPNDKLLVRHKLYELEEELKNHNFIRISKSHLVNIRKILYIKPMINSKIKIELVNGEFLEVNRTYIKEFKQSLKI